MIDFNYTFSLASIYIDMIKTGEHVSNNSVVSFMVDSMFHKLDLICIGYRRKMSSDDTFVLITNN